MEIRRLDKEKLQDAYGILTESLPRAGRSDALYPTFAIISAGGKTTKHAHFEAEIFLIQSGVGTIQINNEKQKVHAGDLIRIPPFAEHELTNLGSDDLVFVSIYSEDFEVPRLPESVIITAAPPTPNGPLHLGHISGPYLASDILSRYLRSRATQVLSHSGTDDHQNYVSEKAQKLNISPEEFRKSMRTRIQTGLSAMNIYFDEFIEPKTDVEYQSRIRKFALNAINLGIIEQEEMSLPFCSHCSHFLVDAFIDGLCPSCEGRSSGGCENCGLVVMPQELVTPKCASCLNAAVLKPTSVFIFNLSKHLPAIQNDLQKLSLVPRLEDLVHRVSLLKDFKVLIGYPNASHSSLKIPGTNQSLHVWFEMAAHYLKFAKSKETWIHSFGFDNSFYYLLFIPALLRAYDSTTKLPDVVITNEFLLLDGLKFSTSRGHAIWADEFKGNTDILRLYLSLQRPSHHQSDFSLDNFLQFSVEVSRHLKQLQKRALTLSDSKNSSHAQLECTRFHRDIELYMSPASLDLRGAGRRLLTFIEKTVQSIGSEGEKLRILSLSEELAPFMPNEAGLLMGALQEGSRVL
jgi:methionyl-tRNA synthetase